MGVRIGTEMAPFAYALNGRLRPGSYNAGFSSAGCNRAVAEGMSGPGESFRHLGSDILVGGVGSDFMDQGLFGPWECTGSFSCRVLWQ